MVKLDYAYIPIGKGFHHPYGRVNGGSSISTKQHDLFYDETKQAIVVFWHKRGRPFYISALAVDSWRESEVSGVDVPAELEKRGPGRPKGSKNKK
jgi:hypothetical protein